MKKLVTIISFLVFPLLVCATANVTPQEISVAGFFPLKDSGRLIYNFNNGWRYHLADAEGGELPSFDDSQWEVVSTPHTVELLPAEGSGCRNYQGKAWYRKHFIMPTETEGKDVSLHFEGVMGKQKFYVNGKEVKDHLGGYLPITINLNEYGVHPGDSCLIAVMADNSDDKTFPPGKPQHSLDFAYHGGIYRDVWMIAKSPVAITDAIEANKVAGGGVFIHFDNVSDESADIIVDTEVGNNDGKNRKVTVETSIISPEGKVLMTQSTPATTLGEGTTHTFTQKFKIKKPSLWSPDSPSLYRVESRVKEGKTSLDGGTTRIGIRSFDFDSKKGFILNGKPFGKLIGANRHQDFAYVGNAVPNSQQWRDAKRLRDAGCRIIRVAHYPQDPAFMDACDELGMFVIVATPGWQYWNKDPQFAERVHENTRNIIRRDRNHPSVLMWEPILNETRYPNDFSLNALQITKDEYPYPGRPIAAADMHSAGVKENYDLVYGWPGDEKKEDAPLQNIFTREFGENVDDWYAHNNDNRASRSWGERPMKVQALSLAKTYDGLYNTEDNFIGGAHWHPFDHQRGYHPDPYWGGIFDAFRQPKYAYHMFRSQTASDLQHPIAESGPMVYIMHEMTQFSDPDVVVFSNCDSVRLSLYNGAKTWTLPVRHREKGMPSDPVVFKNVWDFWEARDHSYTQKDWQSVNMVAEGIINGEVVASERKMPSRRSTKLRLTADWQGKPLVADGSDFIVVVAEVTDDNGNVKRLAKDNIVFEVEGEGEIIGDATNGANPRAVEWGSAPVLIRSTRTAGPIKIKARVQYPGTHAPTPAELIIESVPSTIPALYSDEKSRDASTISSHRSVNEKSTLSEEEKQKILQEVDIQQQEFGIQK